jgi:hypothetical protein
MRKFIIFITVGLALVLCASAMATTPTFSAKFTTTHPNRATGLTLKWVTKYQPTKVTISFPGYTGKRGIPSPAAQRASLQLNPTAVKDGGKVGSGTATFAGKGVPSRTVTALNHQPATGNGVSLVVNNAVGVPYTLKGAWDSFGAQLVLSVPAFKTPRATLTGISVTLKGGTAHRPFLKTPQVCPKGGWKFSAAFVYHGHPTQVLHSTSACVMH